MWKDSWGLFTAEFTSLLKEWFKILQWGTKIVTDNFNQVKVVQIFEIFKTKGIEK